MLSINPLLELGLSKKEALTYIALHEQGETSPSILAELLEMPRSTVYETLKNLIERGLISQTSKSPKKFKAQDPKKLVSIQQKKILKVTQFLEELEKSLPNLNEMYKKNPNPSVKLYQGEEGVLNVCKQMASLSQDIYTFNAFQEFPENIQAFWEEFPEKRRGKFACISIISADEESDLESIKTSWESWSTHKNDELYLVSSSTYPSPANIYILEELTVFLLFRPELMGITIQNPQISETMKVMHELARKNASKNARLIRKND